MLSLRLTFAAVIPTPRSHRMRSRSPPETLIDFREPIHQLNLVDHPPGSLLTVRGNSIKAPEV